MALGKSDGMTVRRCAVCTFAQRDRDREFSGGNAMFETLDKLMMAGLGALTMTRERAEAMFDEYVSKGQAVRETRTGFVKEVMDSAERTRAEFQKLVSEQVRQALSSMHLASKDDIERLERKIDLLLAKSNGE